MQKYSEEDAPEGDLDSLSKDASSEASLTKKFVSKVLKTVKRYIYISSTFKYRTDICI